LAFDQGFRGFLNHPGDGGRREMGLDRLYRWKRPESQMGSDLIIDFLLFKSLHNCSYLRIAHRAT